MTISPTHTARLPYAVPRAARAFTSPPPSPLPAPEQAEPTTPLAASFLKLSLSSDLPMPETVMVGEVGVMGRCVERVGWGVGAAAGEAGSATTTSTAMNTTTASTTAAAAAGAGAGGDTTPLHWDRHARPKRRAHHGRSCATLLPSRTTRTFPIAVPADLTDPPSPPPPPPPLTSPPQPSARPSLKRRRAMTQKELFPVLKRVMSSVYTGFHAADEVRQCQEVHEQRRCRRERRERQRRRRSAVPAWPPPPPPPPPSSSTTAATISAAAASKPHHHVIATSCIRSQYLT